MRTDTLPLVSDLDGTLVKTDMLYESFLLLVKKQPWCILYIPFLLIKGRSFLKQYIADRVCFDHHLVPFNEEVVQYIREQRAGGRKTYLVTASHHKIAQFVQDKLGLFDEIHGSNSAINLKGKYKAQFLDDFFQGQPYEYIGDCSSDILLWEGGRHSSLVASSQKLWNGLSQEVERIRYFPVNKSLIKRWIKAIRVHQWAKNTLIFVPLILAHRFESITPWLQSLLAFFSFSMCASGVYVTNDLLDLSADRTHPRKQKRPFASGEISLVNGAVLAFILYALSLTLAFMVTPEFVVVLGAYFVITTAYSFYIKHVILLDVFTLAALYTIRILAGGSASGTPLSHWLLGFSIFFFLSLAFSKRKSELLSTQSARAYREEDEALVSSAGIGVGIVSTLIFALYIDSSQVKSLYQHSKVLIMMYPILLYWILRLWVKTARGEVRDDPVVFALKDKTSYLILLIMLAVFMLSGPI